MPTFDDIEMAFMFVSSGRQYENAAVYCRKKDTFLYASDSAGENEIPEDYDPDKYVDVPHKNELDLGKALIFRFVKTHIPDKYDEVRDVFSHRGAYSQYKYLLERLGVLKEWYDFENAEQRKAIEEWCRENKIPVKEK